MPLLPCPDGGPVPKPRVPQGKSRKTGTKHGVRAAPPRLSYRIRLPERDTAGNVFPGPEHTVDAEGAPFLSTRPSRSDWCEPPPPFHPHAT